MADDLTVALNAFSAAFGGVAGEYNDMWVVGRHSDLKRALIDTSAKLKAAVDHEGINARLAATDPPGQAQLMLPQPHECRMYRKSRMILTVFIVSASESLHCYSDEVASLTPSNPSKILTQSFERRFLPSRISDRCLGLAREALHKVKQLKCHNAMSPCQL